MQPDAMVNLASLTKAVGSAALMTLWDEGKFSLDDPVSRFLPDFANLKLADGQDAATMTMRKAYDYESSDSSFGGL
ncbi:serine hydrolase [Candidatus Hydrogenedentota bacterium]